MQALFRQDELSLQNRQIIVLLCHDSLRFYFATILGFYNVIMQSK